MNIPLTSFTLADGAPLGKFPECSPGFTVCGALRWDNDRDPPRVVCLVSTLANLGHQGALPVKLKMGVLKIGALDEPTFEISWAPMVSGRSRPGKRVDLSSNVVTGNEFEVVEATDSFAIEPGTICYALCIRPSPGMLCNDELELLAVELLY
jgi:hypothetical protein